MRVHSVTSLAWHNNGHPLTLPLASDGWRGGGEGGEGGMWRSIGHLQFQLDLPSSSQRRPTNKGLNKFLLPVSQTWKHHREWTFHDKQAVSLENILWSKYSGPLFCMLLERTKMRVIFPPSLVALAAGGEKKKKHNNFGVRANPWDGRGRSMHSSSCSFNWFHFYWLRHE